MPLAFAYWWSMRVRGSRRGVSGNRRQRDSGVTFPGAKGGVRGISRLRRRAVLLARIVQA